MNIHLHVEVISKNIEKGHAVDIWVQGISGVGEYENRPEKVDEDSVYDGVSIETVFYTSNAFSQ